MHHLLQTPTRKGAVVIAGFTVLTTVAFAPLVLSLDSAVLYEPGDASSTARDYWAAAEQGKTPFTLKHDGYLYAPEGQTRAPAVQVANAVQPAFVLALRPLFGYLGSLNLYMLLGFVLTGAVMFALLDRVGLRPAASALGGFLLAFNWWQYEQAFYGHTAFSHAWIFPLLVLQLLLLRSRPAWRWALLVGLTLGLAFYLSSYYGLFSLLLVSVGFGVIFAQERSSRRLLQAAIVFVSALFCLFPAFVSAFALASGDLTPPASSAAFALGADLRDYLLPSAHHPVLGSIIASTQVGESVLFVGWAALVLAVFAVVQRRRILGGPEHSSDRAYLMNVSLWLVPMAVLMSLPAYLTIGDRRVPLPDAAWAIGSVVSWWRIYARFGVLVGFAVAVLAALAADHLLSRRAPRVRLAVAGLAAFAIFEATPGLPVRTVDVRQPSPTVEWLAAHPGGIVAVYPLAPRFAPGVDGSKTFTYFTWRSLFDQTRHRHPLYSLPRLDMSATRMEAVRLLTLDLEHPETPKLLRAANVRYVVSMDAYYRQLGRKPPQPAEGLIKVADLEDGRIFSTAGPASDVSAEIERRQPELARIYSIASPSVRFGKGFRSPEDYFGATSRWHEQDGIVTVRQLLPRNDVEFELHLRGFANKTPRTLEVFDRGRKLAQIEVATHDATYTAGPFRLTEQSTEIRLHVTPWPMPRDEPDPLASVFVIDFQLEPVRIHLRTR